MDRMQNGMNKNRNGIILSVIIILLLVVIAALGVRVLLPSGGEEPGTGTENNGMAYEANIVVDDADALQDAVNRLYEKAKEGQMALEMQTVANSEDGTNFTCYLANAAKNNYDMFMVLYLDDTQQEIYRTGLIPIGARMETFVLEETLEPGSHEATLVFNQVEDDRETIHAQVNVGLTLVVK